MMTVTIISDAFKNARVDMKIATQELSEVMGMTLVEVTYGEGGMRLGFEKAPRRAPADADPYHTSKEFRGEHEKGHCWCGAWHAADDSMLISKPVGPLLKDIREGDISKMPAK